jgi:hypothetical protein
LTELEQTVELNRKSERILKYEKGRRSKRKNSQTPRSIAECAVPKERTELKDDKRNSKKQNKIIKRNRNSDSLERQC